MQIHIELCKTDKTAAPIAGEYTPELSFYISINKKNTHYVPKMVYVPRMIFISVLLWFMFR